MKLIKEVQSLNSSFQACDIRGKHSLQCLCMYVMYNVTAEASYTYYKTLTQEESLVRRGKAAERSRIRRRREGMIRVSLVKVHSVT